MVGAVLPALCNTLRRKTGRLLRGHATEQLARGHAQALGQAGDVHQADVALAAFGLGHVRYGPGLGSVTPAAK